MGYLDFNEERGKRHLKRIKSVLLRRGLEPDPESEWIIHGPHSDMGIVYIGCVREKDSGEKWLVTIYPRAVYVIDDPDDWNKISEDSRWWLTGYYDQRGRLHGKKGRK
jgi:hypothetical protein